MKKYDQKGIALITVLVVAAIVMALSGLAYQFLIKGTIISGINLRYKEAGSSLVAGAQYTKWVIKRYRETGSVPTPLPFGASTSNNSCLSIKLNNTINNWGNCPKTADPINSYDIKLSLGNYTVYVEIVNTLIKGNTKTKVAELIAGAVSTVTTVITPPVAPYLYRIELIAVKLNDVQSKVSALFGY